jgi:hypothetical protein
MIHFQPWKPAKMLLILFTKIMGLSSNEYREKENSLIEITS